MKLLPFACDIVNSIKYYSLYLSFSFLLFHTTQTNISFLFLSYVDISSYCRYQILKQFSFCGDTEHEDDDIVSVSSMYPSNIFWYLFLAANHIEVGFLYKIFTLCRQSRQSSITPKAKASKFTSTNGFKFQSDARAEKRKEVHIY